MITTIARAATTALAAAALLFGCSTVPATTEERDALLQRAEAEREEWKKIDPDMEAFVQKRWGHAFFPEVTKGGLVFGGAYGRGAVYEQGHHVGYADVTEGSFGLQIGGQTYSELIVFQDKYAFERFKRNAVDFGANASAIMASSSASSNASFVDGIAVFIRPISGAMAEASIGGQRFTYVPK